MSQGCDLWGIFKNPYIYQMFVCIIFLLMLLVFPSGFRFRRDIEKSGETEALRKAMEEAKASEISLLTGLVTRLGGVGPGDRLKYVGDRLGKAIEYASRRHDWFEDQRAKVFQGVLAISSAIFVVSGWIAKDISNGKGGLVFGFLVVAFIGLGSAIFYYNDELDAHRPYRLVSDIRIWFFKYNLPNMSVRSASDKYSLGGSVLRERAEYFKRAVNSIEFPNSIREDLEQIFILQLLQRYKSESLRKMRWLLSYFAVSFAAQIGIWLVSVSLK